MITLQPILSAIDSCSSNLSVPPGMEQKAILAAITLPETNWGERWQAGLFEAAYYRGGKWYNAAHVRKAVQQYESLASCSYGPWQLLYISALELGYSGHPTGLMDPAVSCPFVVKYLNTRCKNPTRPEDYADAYNSGTNTDRFIPVDYTRIFMEGYQEALAHYDGRT